MALFRVAPQNLIATEDDHRFAFDQRKAELLRHWQQRIELDAFWHDTMEINGRSMISLLSIMTHNGTHIDAPRHMMEKGFPVDQLPLAQVAKEGVLINLPHKGPNSSVSVKDILDSGVELGEPRTSQRRRHVRGDQPPELVDRQRTDRDPLQGKVAGERDGIRTVTSSLHEQDADRGISQPA